MANIKQTSMHLKDEIDSLDAKIYIVIQWRIQDFPGEGAPSPKVGVLNYYIANILPNTA